MKHVMILGAGFAGLELATTLSDDLSDEVHVTLIDQNDYFVFGFSKLDVMFGKQTKQDVRFYYGDVMKHNVEFREERIISIDPVKRHVVTDQGAHDCDILVVALGADLDPAATPGFVDGGYEFYSLEGAERTYEALERFDSGVIVLGILGLPYKCPPAPYEAAFLMHDYLTERGIRDATQIRLFTPMPLPIPVSKDTSKAIVDGLVERGVDYVAEEKVTHLDPAAKVAHLAGGGTAPYDLFLGIPIHKAPDVVQASGMTEGGTDGWIAVDAKDLSTRFRGVYALGDNADAPIPRAGTFAESAARVLAGVLAAEVRGDARPPAFDGSGVCYIEFGEGKVGRVDAIFLGGPEPVVPFTAPSIEIAREKAAFASSRLQRWFVS